MLLRRKILVEKCSINQLLKTIKKEKEFFVRRHDFATAANLRDVEVWLGKDFHTYTYNMAIIDLDNIVKIATERKRPEE
jgi:hypothetical protein